MRALFVLLCYSALPTAYSERIAATLSGYSYTSELSLSLLVNDTVEWVTDDFILDTSFAGVLLLASSNKSEVRAQCLYREVDMSWAIYYSQQSQCPVMTADLTLGTSGAVGIEYSLASNVTLQNGVLHDWADQGGMMGLGLNGSGPLTPFQQLLQNSSTLSATPPDSIAGITDGTLPRTPDTIPNTAQHIVRATGQGIGEGEEESVFGLDFNPAGEASYIDMGYESIPQGYRDTLQWSTLPPSRHPSSFSLFVDHMAMCGQNNLLTNWSTSWAVQVDTGSSCLTLPDEIYDTFVKYLNSTVSYAADGRPVLPALTFQVTSSSSQGIQEDYHDGTTAAAESTVNLSIFLERLVVADEAIIVEQGAPRLYTDQGESTGRLCVLKGSDIHPRGSERFSNPPIVFGALVLQSLYYAADTSSGRVGLAQKNDPYAALRSQQDMCIPLEECLGDERFNPSSNTCRRPECANYFYSVVDEDTGECSYDSAAVVLGCLLLVGCLVMEIWGFLVVQYGYMKDGRTGQSGHRSTQRQWHSDDDSYPTKPSAILAYCTMVTMRALDTGARIFMRALLCFTDELVFARGYATRAAHTAYSEETQGEDSQRQRARSRSRSSSLVNILSGGRGNSLSRTVGEGAAEDAVWGQRYEVYRDPLEQ